MTPSSEFNDELRLTSPGGAFACTLGYALAIALFGLAVHNLLHRPIVTTFSMFASILWICVIAIVVSVGIRDEGGLPQYVVNRIGCYSDYHFVRIQSTDGVACRLLVGYLLLGRSLRTLNISIDAISSLHWSSGQATSMAGRDMDDWSVVLWYHHPKEPQRKPYPGVRNEEVFIIGPTEPRVEIEKLGKKTIQFLVANGIPMRPGKDDCEFLRDRANDVLRTSK